MRHPTKFNPTILSMVLFVIILILNCNVSYAQELNTIKINSMSELQDYFTYSPDKPIIISGHRGGMAPGYPENSIEAIEKTLSVLPSFVEIDPRLTRDSVLVLMHDNTIDRTTNGTGLVSDYTYEELQQFYLKDTQGNVTPYKIPTLIETLEWGRYKTIFNLDNKRVPWEMYSELLNEHNFSNIVLSVRSFEEAMFYFERHDDVMLCVAIQSMEDYETYENSDIPWDRLIAYVGYTMEPDKYEMYSKLRDQGVMIFIAIAPTHDRMQENNDKIKGYLEEIDKQPDIIETDYPHLFIDLPINK